jgi:4-hydroxyphenylpyruvate dioxygenase
MRRAIATISMGGTLRDKLEAIAAARFDAVELFELDFIGFRGTRREVQRLASDLGIAIDLYHSFQDFEGVPDAVFRRALDHAERKFDLVASLGVPMVSVTSNRSPVSSGDPGLAAEQLHALAERAARRNIRLAFEAVPSGRWVQTYQQAWSIVHRVAHPHVGLLVDSFHTLSSGGDLAGLRDIPGNRIFFVRVADVQRVSTDEPRAAWYRTFPGQGDLDVVGFFEQVLLTGYAGTISLTGINDVFRATPNRRTGIDAMRSVLFLESQVRARLERAGADDSNVAPLRILDTVPLFDPPEASRLAGIAFLECSVDDRAAVRLGALLEQLGFTRYGRHRTKAVTLYRQGDIRLVLNAEPESSTPGRSSSRPVRVSCLGLVAEHPGRAASRGSALLSARHDSARGAQELELPTIVAPGGMRVQFVPADQAVENDFVEEPGKRNGRASGLIAIDHVAMGLLLEQLDTWVLFCRAVLGLTSGERVDLAEPFGFTRSHGLANEGRSLRILLKGSATARTHDFGAVPQPTGDVEYIALACDDIFSTVERLQANGVAFVPISDNYYDDLEARGVLDDAMVERMRPLAVMFDGAAGGTYFHASTEAFEGCFYVQVVQRNAYDGYGAVNAPVRAASAEQLRQTQEWLQTHL